MDDLISRQTAIDALTDYWDGIKSRHQTLDGEMAVYADCKGIIKRLPSAQPDAIPLEWIAKHLEWLDNCDNDFAQLAKVAIRAMVEIWKKDKT